MKPIFKRSVLLLASSSILILSGCGGGGGGSDTSTPPVAVTPVTTQVVVTPSLGRFSVGTVVNIKSLAGVLLKSGTITADGSAALTLTDVSSPIVVEVVGADGVQYYDEFTKSLQNFGVGKVMRAIAPSPLAQIGVTPLTNAAVIRLEASSGGLAGASATSIQAFNAEIATLFHLVDILGAPNPVNGSTGNTLSTGNLGDLYALVLAALAKTAAGTGLTAADVADALASDLKDGIFDGQDATTTPATVLSNYSPGTLAAAYQAAAADLGNAASVLFVADHPLTVVVGTGVGSNPGTVPVTPPGTTPPVTTPPVTTPPVTTPPTTATDVVLARAFFNELRTTLSTMVNSDQTGFVNVEVKRIGDDLKDNVAPELPRVADQVSALGTSVSAYDKAFAGVGYSPGEDPLAHNPAQLRSTGNQQAAAYGIGSFDQCWTDATGSGVTQISCLHTLAKGTDWVNHQIASILYVLTSDGIGGYSYTATAYTQPFEQQFNGSLAFGPYAAAGESSVGTVTKVAADGVISSIVVHGALPATSATSPANIDLTATRSLIDGGFTRYALTGSLSAVNLAAPEKTVTFAFGSGSQFDILENVDAGNTLQNAYFVGQAQTAVTKFDGTLSSTDFLMDANAANYGPTKASFTGVISDLSAGASEVLNGTLTASVKDYQLYSTSAGESANNYLQAGLSFTGTIQAPQRPLLTTTIVAAKSGLNTTTAVLEYHYDSIVLSGSALYDSVTSANNTLSLHNQAGIVVDFNLAGQTANVSKSGTTLATIRNGTIVYIDGVTESLK